MSDRRELRNLFQILCIDRLVMLVTEKDFTKPIEKLGAEKSEPNWGIVGMLFATVTQR